MDDRDRGQSELLGFLLVFALVVLTIALVGATGYAGLHSAQDYQRTTNAEYAMTALADNVDDVVRRGAPGRNTQIGLSDASLSLEDTEEITVTVDGNATTVETRPIVYDAGTGTTIVYSSGAVVRQDQAGSIMLREPGFVLTEETMILPIVEASPAGDGSVGGTTDVGVETRSAGTEPVVVEDDVSEIVVEVTSPRVESWARYLDETAADCADPVDRTVECEVDAERAYVTVERVDVRFR